MSPDRTDSTRARAWRLFDELAATASHGNPWELSDGTLVHVPDLALLGRLLAVPVALDASTQSGVPALALDVWVAHELRRAGLSEDEVWPRAAAPRVLTREVAALLAAAPVELRAELARRLSGGMRHIAGAEARVLGKNYVKQVDVVVSSWDTGPQVLVSTKRMDSALGKNAANRVEESYGDARNLRSRYPRAALGFVYSLRAAALDLEPEKAAWLIDLLGKLGREDDAYDAVALLLPVVTDAPRKAVSARVVAEVDASPDGADGEGVPAGLLREEVGLLLADLPTVELRTAGVPDALRPGRFFEVMVGKLLGVTPVDFHRAARALRDAAPGAGSSPS